MHIVQRGNNRSACFYSRDDYTRYSSDLQRLASAFRCEIHAFVLMTNHVHLLLTPQQAESVSLLMKHLNQRYAQYANRTYARTGSLWEGRFRSCIVGDDVYVLRCYRYIELNPVRAAMVRHPRNYPWSSYRFNAEEASSGMLSEHACYQALGADAQARREEYRKLVDSELEREALEDIRKATNGNFVLGRERFQRDIEAALGRRASPGMPGRPRVQSNSRGAKNVV